MALVDGVFLSVSGGMKSSLDTMLNRAADSLVAIAEELLDSEKTKSQ